MLKPGEDCLLDPRGEEEDCGAAQDNDEGDGDDGGEAAVDGLRLGPRALHRRPRVVAPRAGATVAPPPHFHDNSFCGLSN